MFEQIKTTDIWQYSIAGNTVLDLAIAAIAFVGFLLVFKIFQVVILEHLKSLAKKTKTDVDDTFVDIVKSLKPPFYSFLAFYTASFL